MSGHRVSYDVSISVCRLELDVVSVCMPSRFSPVRLLATPRTVARQALLSMGCFRQGCWSGLLCPPPGGLSDPRVEPASVSRIDWRVLYHYYKYITISNYRSLSFVGFFKTPLQIQEHRI